MKTPLIEQTTIKHINTTLVLGGSATIAPDTPRRNYLRIKNGAGAATLKFGNPATGAASDEWPLAANEVLTFDTVVPTNSINIFAVAGTTVSVMEGVRLA